MSLLQAIHTGRKQQAPRLLVYGSEGVGKTTFASQAPKPIFIPTEDGLDNVDCHSFPLCKTYKECIECLRTLVSEKHDYQTVVIDTIDWLERLIFDDLCRQYNAKSIDRVDGGFGKGVQLAVGHWREIIDELRRLREERGMISILLAHTKIESYTDPESTTFDRFSPKLHKYANDILKEWCDAILLATRERGAAKGEKSGGERVLRCVTSPSCVAKNRYNLPEIIRFSWTEYMNWMMAGLETPFTPE